jgi:hypothetical protein
MRKVIGLLPFIMLTAACVNLSAQRATQGVPMTTLAGSGNANPGCRILIATNATVSERYAADELALHLGRMLGTTNMTIAEGREAGDSGWVIRLTHDPVLGYDSYRLQMKPTEKELVITGGRPRGVLMGAYGLLADQLGCRWYTPDIATIPAVSNLSIPSRLDVSMTPPLEYRHTDWGDARNPDWAARNRLNGGGDANHKHDGRVIWYPWVHTFDYILSPAVEFDAHPEYFAMFDGKRQREGTQLCLSNPEVLKAAIAKAMEWAGPRALGGNGIMSISQNDYPRPCECPACKAVDDEEGSNSGSLIRFVNKVAEALEKDYPNVTVETLAYLYSRKPPLKTKPRHNVIVRLCSIECCFSHPLGTCNEPDSVKFMEDIKGWNKLTDRLYLWDYTTDFCQFLMPFPNLDVIDQNMRTFVKYGVKGMFEEGNPDAYGEFGELRTWMLAQLMWNPDLSARPLQTEFIERVYGPCARTVMEYLDIQRQALAVAGDHVKVFDHPKEKKFLSPDTLARCDIKLEEAEQIAKTSGDPALMKRILNLRMCIWYTQFQVCRQTPSVVRNAARRLTPAGREFGLTRPSLYYTWAKLEAEMEGTYVSYPFQVEATLPTTMAWGPASAFPFLGRVLFRNGANSFGMWDTGFDDKQGTMEAWVYCGTAQTNYGKGWGSLFEIRETRTMSGHRVWIDVDVEKGSFTPNYETWASGVTNRIVGQPMTTGAWHHVSATWDATRMALYADASPAGMAPYAVTDCSGERVFYVGVDLSSGIVVASCFGPIDEVRLSKVVRKPALQKDAYKTDVDTLMLLNFDEEPGKMITDSSKTVK